MTLWCLCCRSLVGMPLLTELITDHCQTSLIGVVIDVPVLTHSRTPVDHMTNTLLTGISDMFCYIINFCIKPFTSDWLPGHAYGLPKNKMGKLCAVRVATRTQWSYHALCGRSQIRLTTAMAVMEDRLGGYKCEFVSGGSTPPNHLACSLCTLLLRDPCLVDCCRAKYCETCVNHLREDGQPCNVCEKQLGKAEPDAKLQRLVLDQKVNISFVQVI